MSRKVLVVEDDREIRGLLQSVLTVEGSVSSRRGRGGTAPDRVAEQLTELRQVVADERARLGQRTPSS